MQKLRIEIISLSYHPLHLVDVSVCVVVVHQLLAHPVLPVLNSKLVKRPIVVEPIPGLRILHQPTDRPLKVLILGQIDPMDLGGLHLLLQHLRAKENYICMSK
jgi:hypothetical protein